MNTRYKYPRTPHLPWSPGVTSDDVRCVNTIAFEGKEVVITEKMDGENTTLYNDHCHARSIDSRHHPSRDWVKQFHASIRHDIPDNWRICGENLFAQHSIIYRDLQSYFYGFSLWDEHNRCASWDDTLVWFEMLGITPAPVLYRGLWDENICKALSFDIQKVEGYVVRTGQAFAFNDFANNMAKWVRPHHVQTNKHWMQAEIIPNQLAYKEDD